MEIYHKYDSVSTKRIAIIYRCSKCGKKQVHFMNIVGRGHANDKHQLLDSLSGAPKPGDRARSEADEELEKSIRKVIKDIPDGRYASLDAELACLNCGHKEPWSFYRNNFLYSTRVLVILLEVFVLIYCLLSHSYVWLLPGAVIILITIILDAILRAKKRKQIAQLLDSSIPTVIIGTDAYKCSRNDSEESRESFDTFCNYLKDYVETHKDKKIISSFLVAEKDKTAENTVIESQEDEKASLIDSISTHDSLFHSTISTNLYQQEYNQALSLLKMPSQENTEKAVSIMTQLAEESDYFPAVQWMAEYSESVLKDYHAATEWYKKLSALKND